MTMDIKTTQLNNTQIATIDTSTTRTMAKITKAEKTFSDELSNVSDSNAKNKIKGKNYLDESSLKTTEIKKTLNTPDLDVTKTKKTCRKSSEKILNKKNLTTDEKKEILKKAEKDVCDNIVLMNNHTPKNDILKNANFNNTIEKNNEKNILALNKELSKNDILKETENHTLVKNVAQKDIHFSSKDVKNDKTLDNFDNLNKTEKFNKEINVEAIANEPTTKEEMTVIKYEPITPIIDVSKSFNSSKTSDIVKFLDSNLTTNNASKASKTESTKTPEKSSEKTIKMTEADAKFFNNLIDNNQQVIEGTKTADSSNTIAKNVEDAKSVQVSKALLNALKESQENNKSFRVDFDKDLSVILRVNKEGKISAEFLPGDKAVEQYLKANIPQLQQQFKDEGLEYENLSYRQSKKDEDEKQKQQHRDNKKENGYE